MAKQGVNPTNEARAIQLLLYMELGYEPVPTPTVRNYPGPQFWVYFFLILAIVIAFRLPPKGAIGIWAGKRSLEWQRGWVRLVSITVPSLLVGSFFVPILLHLLGF